MSKSVKSAEAKPAASIGQAAKPVVLSTPEIRLACLKLAVNAYPRSARPPGGELALAGEYLAWTLEGAAPPAALGGALVQQRLESDDNEEGDDDDSLAETIVTQPTAASPAATPASLRQAKE